MFHPIQRPFGRAAILCLAFATVLAFAMSPTGATAQTAGAAATTGSGSYVCTPAGFGSKSRCFRRKQAPSSVL